MSGWDGDAVTSLNVGRSKAGLFDAAYSELDQNANHQSNNQSINQSEAEDRFRQFLRNFSSDNQASFKYREELKLNFIQGQFCLIVSLNDFHAFDPAMHDRLIDRPMEFMPLFENAATQVARSLTGSNNADEEENQSINSTVDQLFHFRHQKVQVQLTIDQANNQALNDFSIRHLSSEHVSKVVQFRGIVVSAGRPRIKPAILAIRCRGCHAMKELHASSGFGGVKLPRRCDTQARAGEPKCPLDPYDIDADASSYIDQQRLKLQELTEQVDTGELPRHVSLACDRYLVGTVKPGSRVTVTGVYTTYEGAASSSDTGGVAESGIRIPYVRVLGLSTDGGSSTTADVLFGMEDDASALIALSHRPNIYQEIANSMCPAIFDNEDTANIKKALAVQLFGGSAKQLTDGMRLRGDINVLLLGDPSVAKSQFLKFASGVAPVGVYTSGKGSSAAGLTASVVRDPGSGEFHLEGGALVLADGGLVCIDEFDKMREQDRVAIHEAMEQQTISIAKAGITTILNARTSVLAAANPIFGRYDDQRSAAENIDFQTSILSRFDMIFIVRDIQDDARDTQLAKHVLNVHRYKQAAIDEISHNKPMIDIPTLKRYIAYARATCHPRLTEQAALTLQNRYVAIRAKYRPASGESAVIPITVRQLEAVIRLSEALARMELNPNAESRHVDEALRLFESSTMKAASQGSGGGSGAMIGSAPFNAAVQKAEQLIKERIPIGSSMPKPDLVAYLERKGIDRQASQAALVHLTADSRREFQFFDRQKLLKRVR